MARLAGYLNMLGALGRGTYISPIPAQGVVTLQQVANDHCFSPC